MTDSQTPQAIDRLAVVLDEIAEMERREGFEGTKIGRRLQLIRISTRAWHGDEWEEVFEDRAVGKICRACEARSKPGRRKWQYYMKWPKAPEGDYLVIVQAGPLRFEGRGGSLALAVATAYRDALKHSTESIKSS